jgi:anaerobic magnesium-protoporphyrin IX monomethyl ester cyclase
MRKEEPRRDYGRIPNLIWRNDGEVTMGPWKVVEDLDTISFPAWDLIDPRTYPEAPHGGFARNFPVAPIIVTRGCPFNCTFCSGKTVTGSTVRKRSIGNVMDEIKLLVNEYGVREIHIEDENLTMHKALVMEFCESLIEEGIKVSWTCPSGVRIDTLDAEMLSAMKESGCYSLAVGVEFGTDKVHALTKKRLTLDVIEKQLDLLSTFDIRTTGFFLMGIPGETREDMIDTIKFARKIKIDRAQFNNFMPLPGSEIYDELKSRGEIDSIDPDHFFVHDVGYVPRGMKRKDIKNLQRRAYLQFYLRPKIIYGLLKDIKTPRHFYLLIKRFIDGLT